MSFSFSEKQGMDSNEYLLAKKDEPRIFPFVRERISKNG